MLLVDTGPLVAVIDKRDGLHEQAMASLSRITSILATTEACLTEALYLLGDAAGWLGQNSLRKMIASGELQVLITPSDGPMRALAIMEKYPDLPSDYADASLIVAAEDNSLDHIFTFDRHFYAYRLYNGEALAVIA